MNIWMDHAVGGRQDRPRRAAGGQRIGLQVHFSIQRLPAGAEVVELNVVVVNETVGISRSFEYVYPIERVGLGTDRMDISTPELTFRGDRNGVAVRVTGKDAQIDITTTTAAPPVLINGQGQVAFLGVDEQYDFAFPAMRDVFPDREAVTG